MKNVTIAGRIGRSAELRRTQGGDPVASFSVAVDDRSGKDKATMWFDCSVWGKRAESLTQYLTKGTAVAVSGELGTREHNGKTYLTVRVNDVTLLGGGERQSGGQSADASERQSFSQDLDDQIPFISWGDVPRHRMGA
jgi:single-strand DNA-binding protein